MLVCPAPDLRPADADYYAERTAYVRQGDLFTELPLGQPFPPNAANHSAGERKFLSGPFDVGFGLLLSPSCSMAAQGAPGEYAHPLRTVVPVLPLAELVDRGAVKPGAVDAIRRYDHIANYFYLPAIDGAAMPESLALLYAPISLHHDYLEDRRVAQLSVTGAVQLKRKLTSFFSGSLFAAEAFED